MSEKPTDTPPPCGKRLLRELWRIYQIIALVFGSAMLFALGLSLTLEPDVRIGVDQAFHIPSRHLDPADFHRGSRHTLSVQLGSGYHEPAFLADLRQAGWQVRTNEQRPWRSFDRSGMTLRLFPGGLFALPTCLDSPDATAPTDTRPLAP